MHLKKGKGRSLQTGYVLCMFEISYKKNWINIDQVIIKMGEIRNPAIAATSYLAADASKKKIKGLLQTGYMMYFWI